MLRAGRGLLFFIDDCPDLFAGKGFCNVAFFKTVYNLDLFQDFTVLKNFEAWAFNDKIILILFHEGFGSISGINFSFAFFFGSPV